MKKGNASRVSTARENGAGQSSADRKRRRRAALRRKRRLVLLGLLFCCLFLAYGVVTLRRYCYVKQFPDDVIGKNITVASLDVAGMTKKEAKKELEEYLKERKQVSVSLKTGGNELDVTLGDLGISYSGGLEKILDEAFDYGKTGSIRSRYRQLRQLEKEKKDFAAGYELNEKSATAILEEQAVPLADHAENATMKRKNDGSFEITEGKAGETVDVEKTLAAITDALNQGWDGEAFTVEMTLKKEQPTVMAADLEDVKDELGSFSTDAGGGDRWRNLMTGAGKINGTVLAPGEEFSVHDATAPYDAEHGYVAAGSYENGQVVDTYGGGICQVSTTLYNAVLYAELEVVKRYPHSMLVSYVDPSRDAAIAGDTKDLVFRNSYDNPIYIEGEITDDNRLSFSIYGKDTRDEGRTVEFESETTATEEYETIYQDDPELPEGEEEYENSPHVGKSARLWKIVKQDGKEVSRDVINESEYQKSDLIIRVGTKTD